LCNENRNLKRDLVVQNKNLKNLEKELVLIREKLGKRPIELNETNNTIVFHSIIPFFSHSLGAIYNQKSFTKGHSQ